jgi:hypothetical protein
MGHHAPHALDRPEMRRRVSVRPWAAPDRTRPIVGRISQFQVNLSVTSRSVPVLLAGLGAVCVVRRRGV